MAWPHRKLLTLALFTIVAPMSFLTVFKIVGIEVEKDIGDSFQKAKPVEYGTYLGCLTYSDRIDFFTIKVQEGQHLSIRLIPPEDADFNLYLYNQECEGIAKSIQEGNTVEAVLHIANKTEDYYIKVELSPQNPFGIGIYILEIKVL